MLKIMIGVAIGLPLFFLLFLLTSFPDGRWIEIFSILTAGHLALLYLPFRIASQKAIAKRHVAVNILADIFLLTCLVICAGGVAQEIVSWPGTFRPNEVVFLLLIGSLWIGWTIYFCSRPYWRGAKALVRLQCKWFFYSNFFIALVALMGNASLFGVMFCILFMLMVLQPILFFKLVDRWQRLHPAPAPEQLDEWKNP